MKKRLGMIITGHVQGVFFRDFVKTHATELGVTGYVRNMQDGRVEVVVEGEEEHLITLLELCVKGPSSAHVTKIEKEWEECTGEFNTFTITY
ncbi:TPA: acylphosphatase [Candidatus Woesearchaeota archaeon]|nr:acylphosphatase [archaeon]HIJ11456.1 acylphosphatase [Candidatus Woesearchaeota archaeon]|tara:strand:- start:249 stop:524 length:276 start_codon:yes stop_codon:yes gene_type:complete